MQKSLRCKDSRLGFGILILFGISLVILNFGITSLSALQDPEKDSEIRAALSSLNWPAWLKPGSLRICCLKMYLMYNTVVVKIQQILYIYSNARKRCLVTLDGEIETWEQLKSIYEKLPQEQFAYAQKGFVVNYKMIKKLNKTGVELVNGENVPISRGMKNEFFANYFEFLGK